MSECQDCAQPILTAYVTDEDGNQWHVRCLDPTDLDYLQGPEIRH